MPAEPDTPVRLRAVGEGMYRLEWRTDDLGPGFERAVTQVRARIDEVLSRGSGPGVRVEAWVDPEDTVGQRVAAWSGLRREGVMRGAHVRDGVWADRVVYARLGDDPSPAEPDGFRALLNSFLPRKRAISQMLVRDPSGRVLLCQLTYKADWDMPGGVVEVGESPQLCVSRELEEELGLRIDAGGLLLTDWLPSWRGWDDALCLVFDGGVQEPNVLDELSLEPREIRAVRFCTLDEVWDLCTDFTARRVVAALASLRGNGPAYTESGS